MTPRRNASRDVHVHIGRLVIDQSILDTGSVDRLKEQLIDRIASRLADRSEPSARWNASDAIAEAVSSGIESRVPNPESRTSSPESRAPNPGDARP
jgi:hypothetical protein